MKIQVSTRFNGPVLELQFWVSLRYSIFHFSFRGHTVWIARGDQLRLAGYARVKKQLAGDASQALPTHEVSAALKTLAVQ